jgi:hypothetical protein
LATIISFVDFGHYYTIFDRVMPLQQIKMLIFCTLREKKETLSETGSTFIPWHLSCNIGVAENRGSFVPLVTGDWLALWRVAVTHHLYSRYSSLNKKHNKPTNLSLLAKFFLKKKLLLTWFKENFFCILKKLAVFLWLLREINVKQEGTQRLTRMLLPFLNGSLKMA